MISEKLRSTFSINFLCAVINNAGQKRGISIINQSQFKKTDLTNRFALAAACPADLPPLSSPQSALINY